MDEIDTSGQKRKGFGSMHPDKRRQIASMGGKAVPAEKRSFSQNKDLAADAGRKGGTSIRVVTFKSRADFL